MVYSGAVPATVNPLFVAGLQRHCFTTGRRQQRGKPGDLPPLSKPFQSFRVKGDVKQLPVLSLTSRAHSVHFNNNAMRKIFPLILACLLVPCAVSAQDSTRTTMLDEVVVSASRTEQPIIDIPRSVTVIHEKDIRSSMYQSLGDLLNTQSGLFIVGANQTPGTNQNVFMRGANSNQVAVLIDGVRITDPSSPNAAIDLSELSLMNIERIEVIRGSHSTIFGGSAVGGVINLITKKGVNAGLHGDFSWQGGALGNKAWLSTENLGVNYGFENGIYLNGALFRQDVRGLDASEKSKDAPSFTADRDDFEKMDGSLKVGFRNASWDANVSFRNSHQYTEIDNGAFIDDDNNYLEFDRKLFQYYAAHKVSEGLRISLVGSFSDSERFFENDSSRVNETTWDKSYNRGSYSGKLQTHELQANYEVDNVRAMLGAGLYHESMFFENYFLYNDPSFPFESVINYDSLDPKATTQYVFAQAGYAMGNFDVSAGARLSTHSTAGNFLTFEINPSYTIEDSYTEDSYTGEMLVYASLSTGFNAPSLYQLYDPSRSFAAYTTRGNSALGPERSLSIEAGVKKEFAKGSYLTLSAYQTSVQNSIEYVYLWNGETPQAELSYVDDRGDTYINVGEQLVRGVEAQTFVRLREWLSVDANLSLLNARIRMDENDLDESYTGGHHVQVYNLGKFLNDDVEQDDVVRRPSLMAYSKLNFRLIDEVTLHAIYRYTGDRLDAGYDGSLGPYGALRTIDVDDYHLVDLAANWNLTQTFSVGLKVENMLDERYREVVGFQTRGRSIYLKLSARW